MLYYISSYMSDFRYFKKGWTNMQKKKPMKEANDSEILNLGSQLLTRDEIKSFVIRLRLTPKDENIDEELRILKQNF